MAKAVEHIRAVVSRILLIGLSIQIILGLFWMCCSFDGMQEFAETAYYLKISESLQCDEYTGILYPFILMLAGGLEKLTHMDFESFVYLLQVFVAFGAGLRFVGVLGVFKNASAEWSDDEKDGSRRRRSLWMAWGSLVLMTFPMAMQCHMAILPNSLAFSCFLLMLSDILAKDKRKYFPVYWLLSTLLMPEYLYFGGALTVIFLAGQLTAFLRTKEKEAGRRLLHCLAIVVVAAGIIVGSNVLTQTHGSQGKVQNSVEAAWFRRNVWTSLADYYFYWPEELKEVVSQEEFTAVEADPGNMALLLQPRAEAALGKEEAKKWFGKFGTFVLKVNYWQILPEMAMDAAGYLFPTVIHNMLLGGRGYASCSPRNYEIMRQDHPLLTYIFMDYCSWWFVVGIVLGVIMWCTRRNDSSFAGDKMCVWACLVTAGVMAAWYTLSQSGLWDYKNVLFTGCLWMVFFMKAQTGDKGEDFLS